MIVIADVMLSDVAKIVGYFVLAVLSAGMITMIGKLLWTWIAGLLTSGDDNAEG